MIHLPTIGSTQDEAKRILKEDHESSPSLNHLPYFAISASEQTNGRGTSGRQWIGRKGNAFLTICVPMNTIMNYIPPTLLPLQMGCIVASSIQRLIFQEHHNHNATQDTQQHSIITLKWPNDVLINDEKISGILIENETSSDDGSTWFIIGIGVNVAHAPIIETTGKNAGRKSTCLMDHMIHLNRFHDSQHSQVEETNDIHNNNDDDNDNINDNTSSSTRGIQQACHSLVETIVQNFESWLDKQHALHLDNPNDISLSASSSLSSSMIISEWERWVEFGKPQIIRDGTTPETVIPLGIQPDGQLRVRGANGKERLLCAEYLF